MAVTTYVCVIAQVADVLGEDTELLEAIVSNDDNLTYGAVVTVQTGPETYVTALTDDGIEELRDMLRAARRTSETWQNFLEDFVDDPAITGRIKSKLMRS